jgi:superfamily II DNA or RNA helicase
MQFSHEDSHTFDPINTKNAIAEKYLSYLRTIFFLSDPILNDLFENELKVERFLNGPFLEITPPYRRGATIADLIHEKILSEEFFKLEPEIPDNDRDLPLNRPLYVHQEQSIRRAIKGENLIISTGTGSGKTESFLIPIINHLMRIKEQKGTIKPGVNAIFLYPMNALVNDQIKRLRNLLRGYQDITFGRYTGETPRHQKNNIRLNDDGTTALPNELLTREEMWATPPHLLFTNYSMLEFLLLRPDDSPLFEEYIDSRWSFIVLDEIHTYTGAKGIEIGMLLRRLQQRVLGDNPHIQCIGTSATLVGKDENFSGVTSFARNIFDQEFKDNSVIQSEIDEHSVQNPWSFTNRQFFKLTSNVLHSEKSDNEKIECVILAAQEYGAPESVYLQAKEEASGDFARFLFHLLKECQEIVDIRKILQKEGTMDFIRAAKLVFSDEPDSVSLISSVIECASHAKPGKHDHHLLPAKYHLFTRAPEGAYIYFDPNPRILLDPHEWYTRNDEKFRVFELASCKECGVAYITGKLTNSKKKELKLFNSVNGTTSDLFLLDVPLDVKNAAEFFLCTKCGEVIEKKGNTAKLIDCHCDKKFLKIVYQIKPPKGGDGTVHTCPKCLRKHSNNPIIGGFHVPKDKISAVVALEFFLNLPPDEKGHRKLISFADSRQDAAYFPICLNREYEKMQIRSLVVNLIRNKIDRVLSNEWTPTDLIKELKRIIQDTGDILSDRKIITPNDIESLVEKYVIEDFIQYSYERGPEALGLCAFEPIRPPEIQRTFLHEAPWNLTDDEVWDLFCIFLDIFRQFRSVSDELPLTLPFAGFPGFKGAYRLSGPSSTTNLVIKAWVSKFPSINKPLDILKKVSKQIGIENQDLRMELEKIWKELITSGQFRNFFKVKTYDGPVYILNEYKWRLASLNTRADKKWYFCHVCNRMTQRSVKGVCPTYQCKGILESCIPEEIFEDTYYWNIYQRSNPNIRMRSCEHTAQLSPERASKVQKAFTDGNIDLLSCSTTFELGVDLGELQGVFLKNVPPTPANYIQRVGRAGRRTPPAYAVTTCHQSPHDMAHYYEPGRMIQGKIRPPQFSMENEKIVRRHLISVALSRFFKEEKKKNREYKIIDSFFTEGGGIEQFEKTLAEKDRRLCKDLSAITPDLLDFLIEIKDDKWTFFQDLFGDEGIIQAAVGEYRRYLSQLNLIRDTFRKAGNDSAAAFVGRIIKSEQEQDVISYLSNHNIIPKYGFPVDVVELKIYPEKNDLKKGREISDLRLQRDLRIALSEYAPGNQIIANGKMWTSRYLIIIPKYNLPEYKYAICQKCKTTVTWRFPEPDPMQCNACSEPLGKAKSYLTPKFGFIDNKKPEEVPYIRPDRSYASRVYYIGKEPRDPSPKVIYSKDGQITVNIKAGANGRLLVLNDSRDHGFWICKLCGYGAKVDAKDKGGNYNYRDYKNLKHKTSTGSDCNGQLHKYSLGHDFQTDVLILEFSGKINEEEGFWESLLYSLIEGICYTLDIDRKDIDGCLHRSSSGRQIIIFDDVPGGAGLVRQCIKSDDTLIEVFKGSGLRLKNCNCGGEEAHASCYGCLKQYKNQYCHELLNRRYAIDFFDKF